MSINRLEKRYRRCLPIDRRISYQLYNQLIYFKLTGRKHCAVGKQIRNVISVRSAAIDPTIFESPRKRMRERRRPFFQHDPSYTSSRSNAPSRLVSSNSDELQTRCIIINIVQMPFAIYNANLARTRSIQIVTYVRALQL